MINTLRIAGLNYEIRERSSEEMDGKLGLADFNNQLISVNQSCSSQTKKIAIYHELIHILSDAYGLQLTEEQVKIGTHALIAFVADNPDFKL